MPRVLRACRTAAAVAAAALCLAAQEFGEYEIKAAFLYNFANFVSWPPERQSGDLVIGIVGEDPFAGVIDGIVRERKVGGRGIAIRRLGPDDDLRAPHILFVAASETGRATGILQKLGTAPVLTVGETDEFLRAGGMIRFYIASNRVRFQINAEAAERARLQISAQLLNLGK